MILRRVRYSLAATIVAGSYLLSGVAAAQEATDGEGGGTRKTIDWLDLQVGLGFSSNPYSRTESQSSIFGRISASGMHSWNSERGTTAIHGYAENTSYFAGGYGSRQNFLVGADTNQQVSQVLTIYGHGSFWGDYAGQLSNRLITVPSEPVPVDPANPLPPPSDNPDLLGLSGRQYSANGNIGASIRTSARGTVSLSAGVQGAWFPGSNSQNNYTSYFGSGGYSAELSERTSLGATIYLRRQDFKGNDWANSVNPSLTASTHFSESWSVTGAAGVIAITEHTDGHKNSSLSPSFSVSVCNNGSLSRFCAHASRDTQTSLSSGLVDGQRVAAISTQASLDYFRRLGPQGTIQASMSAISYHTPTSLGKPLDSSYLSGVVGYDRHIGNRLSAGVQTGVRKLFETGPDPKIDYNANVYVRYRLGDLL